MSSEADALRAQADRRFAAADWLQERLENAGLEAGAGWVLYLVDGVIEHVTGLKGEPPK